MARRVLLIAVVLFAVMATSGYSAERPAGSRMRGMVIYGDWTVKMKFGEREFESILSFTRGAEGGWAGQWISFFGVNDLKDVKFEDGVLTFSQVMPGREGQTYTSNFTGKIEEGKLTGTLKGERGETQITGERARRVSRAVGDWELKYKIGERDVTSNLIIKENDEGELTGLWKSRRGESAVSDLTYERGALSFKRTVTFGENTMETTFEGRLGREGLTGTLKSERGEIEVTGTPRGGELIGTWNLEMAAEQRSYKQRLVVNRDMSGLYGSMAVKEITLEDGAVKFTIKTQFGDQEFTTSFEGKLAEGKLTGEMKSSFGATKVTGTKVVRRLFGRQRPQQQQQ